MKSANARCSGNASRRACPTIRAGQNTAGDRRRCLGDCAGGKRRKRHCDPQSASRPGGVPRRRQRHFERARGLIFLTGRRSSGGYGRFGATTSAARMVLSHINNDSRVNSPNALRAAYAVAPHLAYPPQERLLATDIKPLARSTCRRRRRGAPPCHRHARGGCQFSCHVASACAQQVMV